MALLTTEDVAQRLGITEPSVRTLIRRGKLVAQRWGKRGWLIDEATLAAYTPQPPGWPKGKTPGPRAGKKKQAP